MTTTPPRGAAGAGVPADDRATLRLSRLLKRPVSDRGGESIGRLADVIVRLRGTDYPLVTGLVAAVGGREIFVPIDQVASFDADPLRLSSARLDLRHFERREGEVLLRADVLGHRLIDVENARLVRAADLELAADRDEWVLSGVDIRRRPRRLFGLAGPEHADQAGVFRDWHDFEWLIGHAGSALLRGPFARIRRLKPAQIADLLENASKEEETEILGRVHADPELEADVFEELDEDLASRLLGARTDGEIAGVLARMRADDAADAIAELPQQRRQPVLDLLPAGQVLVEFLENIGLKFGVVVHLAEDLGLLLLGGVLEQVGDLGRLQPADAGERPAQQRAALVPDEGLEVVPVPEDRGALVVLRSKQPEQPARPAPGIHPGDHPLAAHLPSPLHVPGQLEVGGPDQAGVLHVDEAVSQHVGAQQHLPFPALEMPQVELGAGQLQRVTVEAAHLFDGHEHLAPADRPDHPGDQRVIGPAEPDDHVCHPA